MKKGFPGFLVLISVVMTVSGCDFLRGIAGRPTSQEIAVKAEAIRLEEEARRQMADTASAPEPQTVSTVDTHPADQGKDGLRRFYIVMASFSSEENAEKYAVTMTSRGYTPQLFNFKSGFAAVGICGTDSETEIKESLQKVKRQDFCPEGVWIFDRNKK